MSRIFQHSQSALPHRINEVYCARQRVKPKPQGHVFGTSIVRMVFHHTIFAFFWHCVHHSFGFFFDLCLQSGTWLLRL